MGAFLVTQAGVHLPIYHLGRSHDAMRQLVAGWSYDTHRKVFDGHVHWWCMMELTMGHRLSWSWDR